MMPLTAALILSSRPLFEQAHACIQNLPVRITLEQNDISNADVLLARLERHRSDVVLLEAAKLALPLEEFVRRLRDAGSQAAVFVLHPEASTQLIHEALRAGAAEYLYPPLTEQLTQALERLSASRARTSSTGATLGKVYGFLSARGGCGATTIAAHTAASLAKQTNQPVLLADFDFEAGLMRFLMKTKSAYSVRDAFDNMHRMDANYWKALVSPAGPNLDVIGAPEELAQRVQPREKEAPHLMRFLRSVYPNIVVDFGRHLNRSAFDSLPELETLFVVTSVDLNSLDQAAECLRTASERGDSDKRIKILLNRTSDKQTVSAEGLRQYLGDEPAATFGNDYSALYEAWSEGRLLSPDTRLHGEFAAFAGSLAGVVKPVSAPAGFRKLFGFLQRTAR